jgi:hypothetical protein
MSSNYRKYYYYNFRNYNKKKKVSAKLCECMCGRKYRNMYSHIKTQLHHDFLKNNNISNLIRLVDHR